LKKIYISHDSATLSTPGLLDSLRAEKFDGGYMESFNSCGATLFHLLDIKKYATINSLATLDGLFTVTQVPTNTAYIPSMMGGSAGDRMSFLDRLLNTLAYLDIDRFLRHFFNEYQSLVVCESTFFQELMANSSLVFLNSDPLADFPKHTSPRVIDIGGISVHAGHNPLDQYWSSVLDRRNHTIFMSYGTFVKSHLMPDSYKETIRETIKKFPEVTFVWKYEKPEHNISLGIDNLIETTWAPQHDLLHDPRLTAFITHGGQGSITESAGAGVPLICIPIVSDQYRNAKQVERNGVGIMLNKDDLGRIGPLEESIKLILTHTSYKPNAVTLASMIADRPFSMKDVFVRNMEFLAEFGPLRRLDHFGAQLNFVQYYLLDVIAFLSLIVVILVVTLIF
ncbi:hypothetical protein PENTCL1PPCAC_1064, partial [Pristionchus entomophagus]